MPFCENKVHRYAAILMVVLFFMPFLAGCGEKADKESRERNTRAERMLSGVWFNEDDNSIAFRAEKDTIYYPDSTSLPVHYRIIADTLYLDGTRVVAYPIEKQTEHLFIFKNNLGDRVRLVKIPDDELDNMFEERQDVSVLNQNKVVKSDSAFVYKDVHYHSYVQVNPTTYKVIRSSVNNDGVTVDNVYYDNIVHISVFKLAEKVFSKDFDKAFFKDYVPADFYSQSILSDITYLECNEEGFHYSAALYIPDSMTSFLVHLTISFDGKLKAEVIDKK